MVIPLCNAVEIGSIPILSLKNNTHYLSEENPFHNTTMNATFLLMQSGLWSEIQRNIILEPGEYIESYVIPVDEKIDDEYDMYYGIFAEMTKMTPSGDIVGIAFAYPLGYNPPQNPPPLPPLFPYPVQDPKEIDFAMYGYSPSRSLVGMGIYDLNSPPSNPVISGPSTGRINIPYKFRFNSIDPDGDDISFFIRWGDENVTDWTSYSNGEYEETHTWESRGNYIIGVKAKDTFGLESEDVLKEMPIFRNKAYLGYSFLNFINNFPILHILVKFILNL